MKFKYFIFFAFVFLLSCTEVKYYKWERSSQFYLSDDNCTTKKFLIANRITKDKDLEQSESLDYLFRGLERQGSISTINFLLDTLKKLNFDVELIELPLANINNLDDTLSADSAQYILKNNNACWLITLDYFKAFFDDNIQENRQETSLDYGGTTIYYASRKGAFRAIMRIYDRNGLVRHFDFSQEPIFNATGNTKAEALKNIFKTQDFTVYWGQSFARSVIKQLSPPQMTTVRGIYANTNKDFKKAFKLLKIEDIDSAKAIYEKYIDIDIDNDNDKIILAKAIYNLAIIYEFLGQLDKSLELANKSYQLYPLDLVKSYLNYLKVKLDS